MPLGLQTRTSQLELAWSPENRYTTCAIRLIVCQRLDDDWIATGPISRVFGGIWDSRARCFLDEPPPDHEVQWRPVTLEQFDYCLSAKRRITGKGGRGGGKTEALAQRMECLILDRPTENGLILSPDFPHVEIVEDALKPRIWDWLLPGTMGINVTKHLWRTIFGQKLKFLSAERPKKLKGYGAGWMGIDEEALIHDIAIENTILCLRKSKDPLIFGAGTPELGMYSLRYDRMKADPVRCRLYSFPSMDNVFIPTTIFEDAQYLMDPLRYQQEVLAQFVRLEPGAVVAKAFDPAKHKIDLRDAALRDITRAYTRRKFKRPYDYISGTDYNNRHPNISWVHKVFFPNIWVAMKRFAAADPATHLAQAMIDGGCTPANTVIIDDASGEYNVLQGKQSPNSSVRLMRSMGFKCFHPKKNPPVGDRVNAFLAKLDPMRGHPTWRYSSENDELVEIVERTMTNQLWKDDGKTLSKAEGTDHDFDAGTYPIAFCEPAERLQIPRVRGVISP